MPLAGRKVDPSVLLGKVRKVLKDHNVEGDLYVVGSRARGDYTRGPNASDLDLAMDGSKLDPRVRNELQATIQRELNGTGADFGFENGEELKLRERAGEAFVLPRNSGSRSGENKG